MNEFDQFVKHTLKVKHYVRYTDDFVIVSHDRKYLEGLVPPISKFLEKNLALSLHPNKLSIRSLYQGIDFLGYVVFSKHRLLRTKTKRRILKKVEIKMRDYNEGKISHTNLEQSLQSYRGVLSHANTHKIEEDLKKQFWF